ncbi:hypothetical protein LguiA_029218 [Lonicera macranthoides]
MEFDWQKEKSETNEEDNLFDGNELRVGMENARSAQSLRLSELMHEANNVVSIASLFDSGTRLVKQKLGEVMMLLESDMEITRPKENLNSIGDQTLHDVLIAKPPVLNPPTIRAKGITNARIKSQLEKKRKKERRKSWKFLSSFKAYHHGYCKVESKAGGGKKSGGVGKSAVKEISRPTVFRCNLAVVVEEIISLKGRGEIKNCHIEAMMKTPFGSMFKAIFDDKIIPDHIGMIGQVGKKIISAYSEKHFAFLITGEVVKLTPDDVSVTFGLPKHGSKIIPRSSESVCGSEFMQRRFKGESSLKVSSVLFAVRSTILEDGAEEDFARDIGLWGDDTPRFVRWNINILRRMFYELELVHLDASKVSKEICNIFAEEEVLLSRHYAEKASKDMKAIEWHTPEEEVVKEASGQGDDKDNEIKDLKKRVAELELMLKLSKCKDLIDSEFVFL